MSGKKQKKVSVSGYAMTVVKAYFGWGKSGVWNRNEQICALGGRITDKNIRVQAVLPMLSSGASPAYVKVGAETWLYAIWAFCDMGMKLVGCAHSHPGGLPVFLSPADRTVHSLMHPGGVSIVLNPRCMELCAYNGNGIKLPVRII